MFRYNNSIAATSVATTPGGRLFFQRHAMGAGKDLFFFGGGLPKHPRRSSKRPLPCVHLAPTRAHARHTHKRDNLRTGCADDDALTRKAEMPMTSVCLPCTPNRRSRARSKTQPRKANTHDRRTQTWYHLEMNPHGGLRFIGSLINKYIFIIFGEGQNLPRPALERVPQTAPQFRLVIRTCEVQAVRFIKGPCPPTRQDEVPGKVK